MEDEGILDVDTRTRMTLFYGCGNPSSNLEVPAEITIYEILKFQMCFIFYRGADTLSCKFSIRLARRFSDLEYR